MKILETERLKKYYGATRGIESVTLSVSEGDFFGFVGPNGSGKSTFLRTVMGLIRPDHGSIRLLGRVPWENPREVFSQIGYLPSEAVFYAGLKVRHILKLSADLRGMDCTREAAILCERLDLDPEKKVETLSLGNRKKVGIVAALQHKPKLCLLDEPTGGLDPLMQREFFRILKERNEDGATVFLSSHILSEVERHCSHAAVIRNGEILLSDRVDRLHHTGVKRVTLRGLKELPREGSVRDLKWENDTATFLYDGSARELPGLLARLEYEDLTVTDPDLEEIFFHYYGKEAAR